MIEAIKAKQDDLQKAFYDRDKVSSRLPSRLQAHSPACPMQGAKQPAQPNDDGAVDADFNEV